MTTRWLSQASLLSYYYLVTCLSLTTWLTCPFIVTQHDLSFTAAWYFQIRDPQFIVSVVHASHPSSVPHLTSSTLSYRNSQHEISTEHNHQPHPQVVTQLVSLFTDWQLISIFIAVPSVLTMHEYQLPYQVVNWAKHSNPDVHNVQGIEKVVSLLIIVCPVSCDRFWSSYPAIMIIIRQFIMVEFESSSLSHVVRWSIQVVLTYLWSYLKARY